jgi:hypothetical protein
MQEVSGRFYISDPLQDLKPGTSLLEDLTAYLKRRGSPDFVFVDSADYTGFRKKDYLFLKETFTKKAFVWIGHGKGNGHRNLIGEDIEFDGHIGIRVDKYIGHVVKNRFSAFEPYIVYPERAKLLNPKFFEDIEKQGEKARVAAEKAEQKAQKETEKQPEQEGVSAND